VREFVIVRVDPSPNRSELELKQNPESIPLQSNKPFKIVTESCDDENGPLPIPEYGDEVRRANEPFTITSCETVDDPPLANPAPMPAPFAAVALILPPKIVKLKTFELVSPFAQA
jgi:hypothetical protein